MVSSTCFIDMNNILLATSCSMRDYISLVFIIFSVLLQTNLVMASMNVDMDIHVINNDDEYADGNQQSLSSKCNLFNNDSSIE